MPLSWNEIRQRAIRFSRDWEKATSEIADYATFWNEFFDVFGIQRRTVASFQEPVKKLSGDWGFIDLFWKKTVLVEHKSRGKNLADAEVQAFDYVQALINDGREDECPRYIILSDFEHIKLFDLDPDEGELALLSRDHYAEYEFPLKDFYKNVHLFAFIPGYKQHHYQPDSPLNLKAVELLDNLHHELEKSGYTGHDLEAFLVRVLFCLFAEDTGIFPRDSFRLYIENKTKKDGSDLGIHIARIFQVLNTPASARQKNLDEDLSGFPYVNGGLFAEQIRFADLNSEMRKRLLKCTYFDWSEISPAAFGSLFQGIMDKKSRRELGAHYTSEVDIMKLIRPLFLDDLRAEFSEAKATRSKLRTQRLNNLLNRLPTLRFFDPACGCGNFLIIAYREIRQLEIDILHELYGGQKDTTAIELMSRVDVDQFYGIELCEWPARIAEVSLWLMDHKMNQKLSSAFGDLYIRIPLKKKPNIHVENALTTDWHNIVTPDNNLFILGNPPFAGSKYQSLEQRAEIDSLFDGKTKSGILDYVSGWYAKAAKFILGTKIRCAFVSTNSICQGEQVSSLWDYLFARGIKIHFAFRTFRWKSDAAGKAHVHVVIIGFGMDDVDKKTIFETNEEDGSISAVSAKNINGYLVDSVNVSIPNRQKPICDVPEMGFGTQPIDGGNYLFTDEEKAAFLKKEPAAKKYFRKWLGADEFINGWHRWCLWLGECPPSELRKMPECMKCVAAVKAFRLSSKRPATRVLANTPTRFAFENMPTRSFILIPSTSSERRDYVPMGFVPAKTIASNANFILPDATLYHFGVLTSAMHMAWLRAVCGRLESRYRYSAGIVYNNFPWPQLTGAAEKSATKEISALAKKVLDVREHYISGQGCTLADLYDPLTMPEDLLRAHRNLDKAVDRLYRRAPFNSERARVEFLFDLYEKIIAPLVVVPEDAAKKSRRR